MRSQRFLIHRGTDNQPGRVTERSYPQLATARAVFRGSKGSGGGGLLLVFTAQNRQPRVHVSPSTMMVAVAMPSPSPPAPPPPFQHCAPKATASVKPNTKNQSAPLAEIAGADQVTLGSLIRSPYAKESEASARVRTSPMLGHWASTQTVLSLSSPMDSRRRAYFSPCAARCRNHAGFFTSGSLPVYGPTGALAAAPVSGAASARHRTTETEPRGTPQSRLPPQPAHTGGRSGRASELCIVAGGIGAPDCAVFVVCRCASASPGGDGFEAKGARFYPSCSGAMVLVGRGKMGIKY